VKIFDQAAARTGLRDHEAKAAGFDPVTVESQADDHKAYYPGSHRITMRFTGDRATGRLLGVQLFGHRHAEIADEQLGACRLVKQHPGGQPFGHLHRNGDGRRGPTTVRTDRPAGQRT
jgi:NADPH-dependent 2,4-dienoyl-CoA reductase/sulfur reductase-like enzyme